MKTLIISFITPDRPGIVDTLSDLIHGHKGNWQKSSLHHISGFFSGVIEIAIADKDIQPLTLELEKLSDFKMHIEQAGAPEKVAANQLVLELTANDRTGIIQEISSIIHKQNGNLLKLVSTQGSAAHTGQTIFKAKVTLTTNNDIDSMITALENLTDDLVVDIFNKSSN